MRACNSCGDLWAVATRQVRGERISLLRCTWRIGTPMFPAGKRTSRRSGGRAAAQGSSRQDVPWWSELAKAVYFFAALAGRRRMALVRRADSFGVGIPRSLLERGNALNYASMESAVRSNCFRGVFGSVVAGE